MPRRRLRMVARRRRDDTRRAFGIGERQNLVQLTAVLEGGGKLQVFKLQLYFHAADIRQGARVNERRPLDAAGNRLGRFQDVVGGYGHLAGASVVMPIVCSSAPCRVCRIFMYSPSRQARVVSA